MSGQETAWRVRGGCRWTETMGKAATDASLVEMEKFKRLTGRARQGWIGVPESIVW